MNQIEVEFLEFLFLDVHLELDFFEQFLVLLADPIVASRLPGFPSPLADLSALLADNRS